MTGRQVFSESEKFFLQELIVKYNLHTPKTNIGTNFAVKKIAWSRLTEEFNSIETNGKRTESQLKKCWDNMKTRRKTILAKQKRERLKTGGGSFDQLPGPSSQEDVNDPLGTRTELKGVMDSDTSVQSIPHSDHVNLVDSQIEGIKTEPNSPQFIQENEFHVVAEYGTQDGPSTRLECQIEECESQNRGSPDQSTRRSGSQLSDSGYSYIGGRNPRARISGEFLTRKENYVNTQRREDELFKLKLAEQKWLVKAAEESYIKSVLEREAAQELLLYNKSKRVMIERELNDM